MVKITSTKKVKLFGKTTGTINLPTTKWNGREHKVTICKKHDKVSECGACGMKFYLIPKLDKKTSVEVMEKEIAKWIKLLIVLKK